MLESHRKITEVQSYEIDLTDDSGLRQKSTFQLMSMHAGHRANIGFTRVDVKNYINARRQRSMEYGEAGCLSQYFQRQLLENLSFFHAYQMDIEEQITNVFWCDANMIFDYRYLVMLCLWTLHIVLIMRIDHLLYFVVSITIGVR